MWVDTRNQFADAKALSTTATANAIVDGDKVIDLGVIPQNRAHSRATINVSDSGNTFTRTTGSFTDDGWAAGAKVKFQGFTSAANNVETTIVTVTATVMTVTAATYATESGDGDETATSVGSAGGQAMVDLGNGEPHWLVVQVTTALAGATSLRLRLMSDSVEALTADPHTHWDSGAIALTGNWAVGTVFRIALPIEKTYKRYVGLWQNVDGTLSKGAVNAFLTQQPEAYEPGMGAAN